MASPKKENNHKPKAVPVQKAPAKTTPSIDPNKTSPLLWILLTVSIPVLFFSIFKNISRPLFWADESMTVVGGQRVLEFGYPKVHDGKNVFYDLRHSDPKLGIDEKTDAYIGGSNWGHYYVAAVAIQFANFTEDIYSKTGIIRSIFAILGILGIALLGLAGANYLKTKSSKILLFSILFLLSAFSVGLSLHIREVRYYPIVIFLLGISIYLFSEYAIRLQLKFIYYAPLLVLSLFGLFITFSPAFFIFYLAVACWTVFKFGLEIILDKSPLDFGSLVKQLGLLSAPFVIALAITYPLLGYFKTFEINEALVKFNGYNDKM
ncbi:MAG: hypothetical protein K2Q22_08690, partial [Cytophagales bacterium]|nr:hypothetical protein [Cytophagales bacterium]